MKRTLDNRSRTLWLIALGLLAMTVILQVIALWQDYEADANYYRNGAVWPVLSVLSAVLASVSALVATFLTPAPVLAVSPIKSGILDLITASLASAGFVVTALLILLKNGIKGVPPILSLLLLIAAAYPILCRIAKTALGKLPVYSGFAAVFATILLNGYLYFDQTVEMNAPMKVGAHVALLFLMLTVTEELRYLLGIAKPRLYLILASCALAFSALAAPILGFVYLTDRLPRLDYFAYGLLLSLWMPSLLWSILSVLRGTKEKATDEPSPQETNEDTDRQKEED